LRTSATSLVRRSRYDIRASTSKEGPISFELHAAAAVSRLLAGNSVYTSSDIIAAWYGHPKHDNLEAQDVSSTRKSWHEIDAALPAMTLFAVQTFRSLEKGWSIKLKAGTNISAKTRQQR
jgi:hypothetical protein